MNIFVLMSLELLGLGRIDNIDAEFKNRYMNLIEKEGFYRFLSKFY